QGAELGRRGEGRGVATGAAPEHEQVAERVRAQAVRAVQAGAGDLAGRVEAGQDRAVPVEDHVRVDRRGYAAHRVVRRRLDRHELLDRVDAEVDARELGDVGEALLDDVRVDVREVEVDVVLVRPGAAALADLEVHRAAD